MKDMSAAVLFKEFEGHDRGVDEGKRMSMNGIFKMAHHLKAIKEGKLYRATGDDGQGTWEAYCASKGVNKHTADKYIGLYRFYIEEMKKPEDEVSNISLDMLSKYQSALVKSPPEKRDELYETMKSGLSPSDVHQTFVEEKLAKPHWLTIKTCEGCKKYEIHYEQDKVCTCNEKVGPAIFAKPILK